MLSTKFTELLGCSIPIQQAAIGDLATPQLATAVAEAGGLGMVCMYGEPLSVIEKVLGDLRAQTSGVFGVNFILRFVDPAHIHESVSAAAARADVVEFFYSDPDKALVDIVHNAGALASWQVGSRDEALAAVDAGCDFIIAQGIEAGGHIRGGLSLLALLDQVLDVVDLPVLAAGGIGSGRAMAAALVAGASGVRVGTRFVGAEEAGAHPQYVDALVAAEAQDTVYTEAFSNGWPDAPHRVLRSSLKAAEAFPGEIVGEKKPLYGGSPYPLHRFQPFTINKRVTGKVEAMPQWAGESVGGVKGLQPAVGIISELVGDCETLLRRWR